MTGEYNVQRHAGLAGSYTDAVQDCQIRGLGIGQAGPVVRRCHVVRRSEPVQSQLNGDCRQVQQLGAQEVMKGRRGGASCDSFGVCFGITLPLGLDGRGTLGVHGKGSSFGDAVPRNEIRDRRQ